MLALIGLGISLLIVDVHRELNADVTYASFCDVNSTVSCSVVLSSPYASFAGVSVAIWACLYYIGLIAAGISFIRSRGHARRQSLANLIFAAAVLGFLFSLYLAIVSLFVLQSVCLMCTGLYVVAIGMLVASSLLRNSVGRLRAQDAAQRAKQETVVWAGSGIALIVVVAIVGWEIVGGNRVLNASEIEQERPDFYRWFHDRPLAEVPAGSRHTRGTTAAPVTVVEFSDFGCSHCAAFDKNIANVLRRGYDVRLEFSPLPSRFCLQSGRQAPRGVGTLRCGDRSRVCRRTR